MIAKTEEEKRIARERRRQVIAANQARRAHEERERDARIDKRFEETRDRFGRVVAYWNGTKDHPSKTQTLRVHRDALHRRLLWSENTALEWSRHDDGTFFLNGGKIDELHKPMALLLQFVKAEHKIAHDRAALALRAKQISVRSAKNEEKIAKSGERPHTPELSA